MFGFKNKKESGAVVIDGRHVYSTTQCVHCGAHENIIPGSKKKRGWCPTPTCKGFLCGRRKCMIRCIPFEAKIEYEEAFNARRFDLIKKYLSKYPDLKILKTI